MRLAELSMLHPRATLAGLATITLLFAAGLPRLDSATGYRVLLGDDHPSIVSLDTVIETYGGGLPLTVAWECGPGLPCSDLVGADGLGMADRITREIDAVPEVRRVWGIANAPLLVPTPDGFAVRRFVENGEPARDAPHLLERARGDPVWRGALISPDGRVGAIGIQPRDTRVATDEAVVDAISDTLRPFEARGVEFHLVGDAAATVVSGRDLAASTAALVPITVLVIAGIVLTFTRSARATLLCLAPLGVALVWTFGLLGWLGWPRDGILEVLAPLVLVIGVCDAIHLLSAYGEALASGAVRRAAMRQAVDEVAAPCLLTTATTAAAFLSFLTSDLDTFQRFGSITAFASVACLALTFTALPIAGVALAPRVTSASAASGAWSAALNGVLRVAQRRRGLVLLSAALVIAFFGAGATRLEVDTDWYESWGQESAVVQWLHFVETRLGPSETLELDVALPAGAAITDPGVLQRVDALVSRLAEIDGIGRARSVLDPLKRLNRAVHGDDPDHEALGDGTAANAELLELLEFEGVDLVAPWMTLDRSRMRLSIATPEQSYRERARTLARVRRAVAEGLPSNWNVTVSGEAAVGFEWIRDVQATQVRSFPTALALALLLIASLLRSLPLAAAALVPTLIPIAVTLGGMGWLGMPLDVGRAMLAAVILGIAIDDAIHFLHRLKAEQSTGRTPEETIARALLGVGPAITTTSVALALGFLTFLASSWQTISSFGFFMALAILGALAATLVVLPALLFTMATRRQESAHALAT